MQTPYPDLLPHNATAYERALSGPTGRIDATPVPLRALWRWDTCPEPHLAWLAWAMSVDLWNDDWPAEQKRAMIRESFELHRRKGTLYAIDRYLTYSGSTLRRAILPPDKPFAATALTEAERADYLARFPQIRVFQFRDRGVQSFGTFAGSSYRLGGTFTADAAGRPANFATISTARERYGRRAFLWDKGPHFLASGRETPLRWIEVTREGREGTAYDYEQVLIPGSQVQTIFAGASVLGNRRMHDGRRFVVSSTARTRIVTVAMQRTVATDQDVATQKTVQPSLEPVTAFPERVAERGVTVRGIRTFAGMRGKSLDPVDRAHHVVKGFAAGFAMESSAGERLYDRIYLHDRARMPDARPGSHYAGYFRLGMPAFHGELSVQITGKRQRWDAGPYCYGYAKAADRTRLDEACRAVVLAKAKRDKVWMKTGLHRAVTSRDRITTTTGIRSGGVILSA